MKNTRLLLVIGQFSLVLGVLSFILNYFYYNNSTRLAFISGLLFGLSLVLNLAYLIKIRNKK